jgi:ribonuclease R
MVRGKLERPEAGEEEAVRIEKQLLKVLRHAKGRPMTAEAVAAEAGVQGIDAAKIEPMLKRLARSGQVYEIGVGRYIGLQDRNLVVGRISVTRRGYGFVRFQGGDIYVSARDMSGAMHGDIVAARMQRGDGRGRSGEVVRIVERARTEIVGRYERQGKVGVIVPSDRRIRGEFFVSPGETAEANTGDVVVARITRYPTSKQPGQAAVTEVLGPENAPGVDIEVVIREHGLRATFPPEVEAAAHEIPEEVGSAEPGREDVRDLYTVTIDPVDAKDFDDAISIERAGKGWRLGVHIADVSHYVPWDSVIDEEARQRATSVYLVDRVLPMLPERLSNGTCSLKPEVDRFSFTVMMDLDRTGLVEKYRIFPSVMRSDRRLAYDQVDEWLSADTGFPDAECERLLKEFRACAAAIQKRRIARGGLDFESVEAKVRLDAVGHPVDVVLRERTVATNMIEEAMILANEVVARHMVKAEAPMVFRVHEEPDPDALAQVAVILKEFDYPIKDIHGASPHTFQKIIAFAHNRPEKLLINSLVLRTMKRARYTDYLDIHFGLASEAYTHFTSPIRRYPDLIVHRLLRAQLTRSLEKKPTADMVPELDWLADHSSTMEREAESAENDSVRIKLCELMVDHIGETYEGIVTNAASFGLFVQLPNTAEGLVHVNTMTDDYYQYDAERFMLCGENHGKTYRLGERLKVRVTEVSVADVRIDLELA